MFCPKYPAPSPARASVARAPRNRAWETLHRSPQATVPSLRSHSHGIPATDAPGVQLIVNRPERFPRAASRGRIPRGPEPADCSSGPCN